MLRVLTIDLETTGLSWLTDKILLIGFRVDGGEVRHLVPPHSSKEFEDLLKDPTVTKRGHNVKFDVLFLLANGYEVNGPLDCTSVLSYLEDPFRSTSLKFLVEEKLHKQVTRIEDLLERTKDQLGLPKNRKVPFDLVPLDEWKPYNAADVFNCDEIRAGIYPGAWYNKTEQPLISILVDTERTGIALDKNYLAELQQEYVTELSSLEKEVFEPLGVNPKSPKQVLEYLNAEGHRVATTDKLVLKKLAWAGNEFAGKLLRYRELSKLLSTYIGPLLSDSDSLGRIHGSFNQAGSESKDHGTKTGRLTSSGPNLQNIPFRTTEGKKIRRAFIPGPGLVMIDSDLKQIEPRLVASFSQSPKLLEAFALGLDTHGLFASDIFKKPVDQLTKLERFIGKTCWLATVYGCSYRKLLSICQTNSDDPLPAEYDEGFFKLVQHNFWAANPEIKSWRNVELAQARALGYVETVGGRKIKINGLFSRDWAVRGEAERAVINYRIQGSAADIMKLIIVRLAEETDVKLLAFVHDEILAEFDPNKLHPDLAVDILDDIMCNTVHLDKVLIESDTKIVSNWSEK